MLSVEELRAFFGMAPSDGTEEPQEKPAEEIRVED